MSKYILVSLFGWCALTASAQSVASLNLRYLYDPQNEVDMAMKVVNSRNGLTVYYRLTLANQSTTDSYSIDWLKFDSYTEKNGVPVEAEDSTASAGKIVVPTPEKPWLLVAVVTNTSTNKSWRYPQVIDAKYPVNGFLEGSEGIVFKPYVTIGHEYTIHSTGDEPIKIYYYKTDFPVASPPFTEKGARQDRFMFADSTFTVSVGQKVTFSKKGLYLAQQDTLQAKGFAFVAMGSSYPKLTRIEDIPDPLIFVSTKEEHDALLAAGDDKTKIDKVILDITRDKDRAKNFMRSYFRRVELTDLYFTSFKEGWKTDRGMVFLIFGLPDEVSKTGPNEVWYYKNTKERFTFVRNGSVYDPNSVVLQRNSKYAEVWFGTVDLWRKSRF